MKTYGEATRSYSLFTLRDTGSFPIVEGIIVVGWVHLHPAVMLPKEMLLGMEAESKGPPSESDLGSHF